MDQALTTAQALEVTPIVAQVVGSGLGRPQGVCWATFLGAEGVAHTTLIIQDISPTIPGGEPLHLAGLLAGAGPLAGEAHTDQPPLVDPVGASVQALAQLQVSANIFKFFCFYVWYIKYNVLIVY